MNNPLVSIITATWGRPKTVVSVCMPSVDSQTCQRFEHIIVTDGLDEDLNDKLREQGYSEKPGSPRRLASLGRNWTSFGHTGDDYAANGAAAKLVGTYLAAGQLITYLDDDDVWLPNHLTDMVAKLGDRDLVLGSWRDERGVTLGVSDTDPPRVGNCGGSMFMHRVELLKRGNWVPDVYECDANLILGWIAGGCSWTWLGTPTVVHAARFGQPES